MTKTTIQEVIAACLREEGLNATAHKHEPINITDIKIKHEHRIYYLDYHDHQLILSYVNHNSTTGLGTFTLADPKVFNKIRTTIENHPTPKNQ